MQQEKVNYTAFSAFLSSFPDEVALRRFKDLSLRNLLFYQAKLAHLERDLQLVESLDASRSSPTLSKRVNYRWLPIALSQQGTGTTIVLSDQVSEAYREKFLDIRQVLAKYNEALGHYIQQEKLPCPSPATILELRHWLDRPEFGAGFLSGDVEDVWDSSKGTQDFLAFSSSNGLTPRIGQILLWLKRLLSRSTDPARIYSVDVSTDSKLARGVSTVISSIFPVLPIIVLFFIPSLLVRIGLVFVFTALFAAILVFGLGLEPEKVLAITTAFAAIQVVFVGSTVNGSNN